MVDFLTSFICVFTLKAGGGREVSVRYLPQALEHALQACPFYQQQSPRALEDALQARGRALSIRGPTLPQALEDVLQGLPFQALEDQHSQTLEHVLQ